MSTGTGAISDQGMRDTMGLGKGVVVFVHGAFLGTFRFVGLYKKVLYTTV